MKPEDEKHASLEGWPTKAKEAPSPHEVRSRWTPTQHFNVPWRKSGQVIIMDLIDTVLKGDDRSYFTFGHGEHLLLPVI